MKKAVISLLLLCAVLGLLAGCGGGGGSKGNINTRKTHSGSATFTITWPKRDKSATRLIPEAANVVVIQVFQGDPTVPANLIDTRKAVRGAGAADGTIDAAGTTTSQIVFPTLPVGTLTVRAKAYPANGPAASDTGAQATSQLGSVDQTINVTADTTKNNFVISMVSTVAYIEISASGPGLFSAPGILTFTDAAKTATKLIAVLIGKQVTLTATPKDASGNAVLITGHKLTWTQSGNVRLNGTSSVNGVQTLSVVGQVDSQTTNATVTDTESGKSTQINLVVGTPGYGSFAALGISGNGNAPSRSDSSNAPDIADGDGTFFYLSIVPNTSPAPTLTGLNIFNVPSSGGSQLSNFPTYSSRTTLAPAYAVTPEGGNPTIYESGLYMGASPLHSNVVTRRQFTTTGFSNPTQTTFYTFPTSSGLTNPPSVIDLTVGNDGKVYALTNDGINGYKVSKLDKVSNSSGVITGSLQGLIAVPATDTSSPPKTITPDKIAVDVDGNIYLHSAVKNSNNKNANSYYKLLLNGQIDPSWTFQGYTTTSLKSIDDYVVDMNVGSSGFLYVIVASSSTGSANNLVIINSTGGIASTKFPLPPQSTSYSYRKQSDKGSTSTGRQDNGKQPISIAGVDSEGRGYLGLFGDSNPPADRFIDNTDPNNPIDNQAAFWGYGITDVR